MGNSLTIHKAAERVGVSVHTLRYYEQIGLIGPIRRASNGHRRFSEEDVSWIIFVKRLKSAGMSISKMLRYAELQRSSEDTLQQRTALLREHEKAVESNVKELNDHLNVIRLKIAYYSQLKNPDEDECV